MLIDDRNYELRNQILIGIEKIERTEYLLRIRRLVQWCVRKEERGWLINKH